MTRIAGIASPAPAEVRKRDLAAALESLGGPSADARSVAGATLAATGGLADVVEHDGFVVVMDGRIYNRDELGVAGDDPTAFATLVRRHGPVGAMRRLNADLAAAVYEPATRTLWLLRDRFGLRPLYWSGGGGSFRFASRPRALLRMPSARVEPDPSFVARMAGSHYRTFDNDPARSPYLGIQQVPPAHVVRCGPDGVRADRYWGAPGGGERAESPEELAELYRGLLADSVRRRLAVVPNPGFTLSGGMDSSSVLASAAHLHGPQPAYSTVYEDPTFDERDEIQPMLDVAASPWTAVPVGDPDVPDVVARMIADHDEPVATATWLSHRALARRAHEDGVTTLFGGLGGDELNAGEYEYFPHHFADLRDAGREDELRSEIAHWARHHDHPIFRKDPAAAEAAMARVTFSGAPGVCRPDTERLGRYAAAIEPDYFDLAGFEPAMEHPFESCLANRCWQDLTRETLPCCLRAEDRNLAPLGMERVHPFLDHRLVELMFRLPGDLKIREGVTKRLLREAMRGVLPEETRTRVAKTGWNAPAHRWFTGSGLDAVRDLVASRSFRERGVYRLAAVDRIIDEHEDIVRSGAARENHMMFLWQLVNTELWLRDADAERASRTTEVTLLATP